EILNYRDTRATVILVSDGIESCNADPCSLAKELERGGIDFTAHVIGFDVGRIADQQQLSCLADETGGQYLTADSAGELLAALQSVAAPPPPMLHLEAVSGAGGPVIADPALRWTVVALDREETILGGEAMARPQLEVEGGHYFARAELGNMAGTVEFDYPGGADALHQVVLAIAASLDAPDEAEVGTTVAVTWTGPNAPGDFIALAEPSAAATAFAVFARTSAGSPAQLDLPDMPGDYELRYVDAGSGRVLALIPIRVVGAAATLEAAPVVEAGSAFKVTWTGPDNNGDFVNIVPADAKDRTAGNYAYTRNGSPAEISSPDQPGSYELRYVSGLSHSVLARLPIAVVPATANLEAPPAIGAGADIPVTWTGPGNRNDTIIIVPAGAEEGARGAYTYTRNGSPLKVRAPEEPGSYELRYVTGQSRVTLARLPIAVTDVAATLEAPPAIGAGADIPVTWTGPDNQNDTIIIVPSGVEEGARGAYTYTRNGSPLKVRAPEEPGSYELRYVTSQTRATIARLPIMVTGATASLEALPTANAGAEVAVTWTGPGNQNDTIVVVPAGAEEGARGAYAYTRNGSPLKVLMPETPGSYELRYVTAQSRQTLAQLPIILTPVTATLEASPVVPAGSMIAVTWTGPANRNDSIAIANPGDDGRKSLAYAYTRNGTPLQVRAPKEAGSYELRYLTGQDKNIVARLPITVN
ncbi:MAG TPA: hypothetical protein VLA52_16130, partial [Thermohalobaculum sp.]|nr:hypothetical protein [Thermohalobaculum sp.]